MMLKFSKGQGTGNDFVLTADLLGRQQLAAQEIRRLCGRRSGVGGDGYIRATMAKNILDYEQLERSWGIPEDMWFMDYWNADGSIAEMCGNGVRVFVHFLIHKRLVNLRVGKTLKIGTRAGIRTVERIAEGRYAVGMGSWSLRDPDAVLREGGDAQVQAFSDKGSRTALSVNMGNPHTVVLLDGQDQLDELDLSRPPVVSPPPVGGTNTEFVALRDPPCTEGAMQLIMRVYERGVGETPACGTGACAAAVAARLKFRRQGLKPKDGDAEESVGNFEVWDVSQPGGTLRIRFLPSDDGIEHIRLSGAAEIVFDGTIRMPS